MFLVLYLEVCYFLCMHVLEIINLNTMQVLLLLHLLHKICLHLILLLF
jgi:hypothetical protein